MGQAAGKALSADRHGSFRRNSERMWAHCRLLLTGPLAAVLEIVIQAAPASLEGTLAKYTHGCVKCCPAAAILGMGHRRWDGEL